MELKKQEDGTYGVNKYYTRGTELIKEDIYKEMDVATVADATVGTNPESTSYKTIQYIMDGHGSVTALAETKETGTIITDA